MITFTTHKRVLYGETDRMGYLYYGNYASYYEVGRVETLRQIGFVYKDLEEKHKIAMPVLEMHSKFIRPATYDEEIAIETEIREMPERRITFHHRLFNESGDLIHKGEVTLVFYDPQKGRSVKIPVFLKQKLGPYFEQSV